MRIVPKFLDRKIPEAGQISKAMLEFHKNSRKHNAEGALETNGQTGISLHYSQNILASDSDESDTEVPNESESQDDEDIAGSLVVAKNRGRRMRLLDQGRACLCILMMGNHAY